MMGSKRLVIAVAVLTGLLGLSSIALADHEEQRDDDTIVSFGYDELNRILAVNSGDNDTPYVCDFENGEFGELPLAATYLAAVDGLIPIDTLKSLGVDWMFDARTAHEVSGEFKPTDPTPYTGAGGVCGVHGAVVGGPNGQVNHGQFMKAAKSLIDIKGHGCIVRHFAKSEIGTTEATKVRTSEVLAPFVPGDLGDITFETFEADCSKPNAKADKGEKGRPDSPGKSGAAPGHNN